MFSVCHDTTTIDAYSKQNIQTDFAIVFELKWGKPKKLAKSVAWYSYMDLN